MTPRRTRMPVLVVLSLVALVALVAACGSTSTVSPSPDGTASASQDPGTSSSVPSDGSPTASPDPALSEPPASDFPTDPPSDAPSPSAEPGTADACTGTDENRDFFAAVADAVTWPVYCPVLAGRWFVDSGQYRLAGGGWLEIAYRGPNGARIALREGAYCGDDDCVSSGDDLGAADFGDQAGTLLDTGGGGFAILVDPDGANAWELIATGLTEAEVRDIGADLTLVAG
ncbi:MAG: hypothetical protein ACSLFN_15590 [Candidatus Limnocylindrales bacterium]